MKKMYAPYVLLLLPLAVSYLCKTNSFWTAGSRHLNRSSLQIHERNQKKTEYDFETDDVDIRNKFYDDNDDPGLDTDLISRNKVVESQKRNVKPNRPVLFNGINKWKIINRAIFAGVFVAGIGTGITIDSAINTNPKDLASRDAIDRNAPNPKLCAQYGSSAMVLDQRVFITFNPFNVYVTQADTKPGCVLRQSNSANLLQRERNLVSDEDFEACKNSFNTWAFVGDINNKPQVNCVYQSDDAQNEFLSNPKIGLGEDIYDKDGNIMQQP